MSAVRSPLVELAYEHAARASRERYSRDRSRRFEYGFRRPRKHVPFLFGPPPHTCVRLYAAGHFGPWNSRPSVLVSVLGLWVRVYGGSQ